VIPSIKSNCSGYPIFSSHLFLLLTKVEAKSLELFWQDFVEQVNSSNSYTLLKGPDFQMAKNWRNTAFVQYF